VVLQPEMIAAKAIAHKPLRNNTDPARHPGISGAFAVRDSVAPRARKRISEFRLSIAVLFRLSACACCVLRVCAQGPGGACWA